MRAVLAANFFITLVLGAALRTYVNVNDLKERQINTASNCSALHFIAARGSYEAPGMGSIGSVASKVCNQIMGCDSYGIDYPAAMNDSATYVASESQGVVAMIWAAKSYHISCPKTPIVLMGYSQGAQVVGDTVCGTSEPGWETAPAINGSVTKRIIAVIQMGDPSFVVGQSYNVGTATRNGTVKGRNVAACSPFASKMQSFCDTGDPYCASGNNVNVHHGYMAEYGARAAGFVVNQYYAYLNSSRTRKVR